jgi:hypothetical protein
MEAHGAPRPAVRARIACHRAPSIGTPVNATASCSLTMVCPRSSLVSVVLKLDFPLHYNGLVIQALWASRGRAPMAGRSIAQAIFGGKPPDPKEQAKQWRLKIKGEMRQLDRQIKGTSPASRSRCRVCLRRAASALTWACYPCRHRAGGAEDYQGD